MKFDKEFKEAISHLPSKEKDRLLLRLLKKDISLANRLYFELIDPRNTDEKRLDLIEQIERQIEDFSKYNSTPGHLMMEMRDISGKITEHVKVTKDKFAEISLNLLMLNEVLAIHNERILKVTQGKARKLCLYIIARAFKLLVLIRKMHEDLLLDFTPDLKKLGELISENDYLMRTAIQNGLDVNWLICEAIPENIEQIQKDLRSQGYLTSRTYLRTSNYKS
ncbi:hypothetical protein IMCC3317_44890 [Kordia antarctica]|uniref:Uncharacterized protein n=1 Tax=Kordia antarctica TaxID=1218801 RepID=A0A7L4ZQT3_9FLAO|nr:hypothetical protein [Kordia antarctica]QHI39088.1 hypothetical protein IMCC3317_44890 [Kordia antarctica]